MVENLQKPVNPVEFVLSAISKEQSTNPYCPMASLMGEALEIYQETGDQNALNAAVRMAQETFTPRKPLKESFKSALKNLGLIH